METVRWGANYLLDCRVGDEQYVAQVSQAWQGIQLGPRLAASCQAERAHILGLALAGCAGADPGRSSLPAAH